MKTCVKPDCKLTCPKGGCHNKTIDLPFAYRLETNAQTSAAAAASPAVKSISAAAEEGEVAWKGLAKVPEAIGAIDHREYMAAAQAPAPAPSPAAEQQGPSSAGLSKRAVAGTG